MQHNLFGFLIFSLILFVSSCTCAKTLDLKTFATLPILHDGRIKPMESFAKASLKKLSLKDEKAMSWLVESLFNPAFSETQPIIKIRNPDILNMLNIQKRKGMRFSYKELSGALLQQQDVLLSILKTPEEEWSHAQADLIRLHQNVSYYGDILSSLTLFLPLSVSLPSDSPASLKAYTEKTLTYVDTLKFRESLQKELQLLLKNKGDNIENFSKSEQALSRLSFAIANLNEKGTGSVSFRIFPSAEKKLWHSPWSIVSDGTGRPETTQLFQYWQELALAYHQGDTKKWQTLSQKIYEETISLGQPDLKTNILETEKFYNRIAPFQMSSYCYALSLFLLLLFSLSQKNQLITGAALSIYAGAFMHLGGIAMRIYILERPPVSTLYESILFVACIAVLFGIWNYAQKKEPIWIWLSASIGVFLHILAISHNQDNDSFLMLTAVLNTNFWLATHVICITIGYALCAITSFLSHYALLKMAIHNQSKIDKTTFKTIHTVALLSLLFASVGTVLGGIWADQSWGRFWGWDPKENGALLIVLWLVWLLHGRISGQMKDLWVTAGLAYLSVIVALSWFGVNLLSVGLHAYGFTDSAAWGLTVFTVTETLFIAGILCLIYKIMKAHG